MVRSALIAAAGALGALARYHMQRLVERVHPGAFPLGTFIVNMTGCFVLGVLVSVLTGRLEVSANVRTALTVGFVGAYTTFSTFAVETSRLGEAGATGTALANVVLSVVIGLVAVRAGLAVGRVL